MKDINKEIMDELIEAQFTEEEKQRIIEKIKELLSARLSN